MAGARSGPTQPPLRRALPTSWPPCGNCLPHPMSAPCASASSTSSTPATSKLSDAEVLTIEVVGEFLGIDTDKGIYCYFRRHYGEWFPALKGVHRTTFCRQAANLWVVKEMLSLETPARPD